MKKRKKTLIILVSSVLLITISLLINVNHDYLLMHSTEDGAAIIIEDRLSVWSLVQRVRFNLRTQHACGYHTALTMVDGHEVVDKVRFNLDCQEDYIRSKESINLDIALYHRQMKETPTHRLYNLVVAVECTIDSALEELDRQGIKYVLTKGKLNQYPTINISTRHEEVQSNSKNKDAILQEKKENRQHGEKKLNGIIEKIKTEYELKSVEKFMVHGMSGGIYEIGTKLYFGVSEDMSNIKQFVEGLDGQVQEIKIPKTYCIPILVEIARNAYDMTSKLDFVLETEEYNQWKCSSGQ